MFPLILIGMFLQLIRSQPLDVLNWIINFLHQGIILIHDMIHILTKIMGRYLGLSARSHCKVWRQNKESWMTHGQNAPRGPVGVLQGLGIHLSSGPQPDLHRRDEGQHPEEMYRQECHFHPPPPCAQDHQPQRITRHQPTGTGGSHSLVKNKFLAVDDLAMRTGIDIKGTS